MNLLKSSSISLLLLILSIQSYPQLLKGEWEGTFSQQGAKYPISLTFVLNADTTYSVYSFSKGQTINRVDTIVACLVHYELISKDSIYLEEVEAIEPNKYILYCFQKMYLQIKQSKKDIELVGKWESASRACKLSGKIHFKRKTHR